MSDHAPVQSQLVTTVKLQIFVRYSFSYFWLETGSYELIFVLSRASKQNYIEIRWPQAHLRTKMNCHPVLNFAFFFSKVRKYERWDHPFGDTSRLFIGVCQLLVGQSAPYFPNFFLGCPGSPELTEAFRRTVATTLHIFFQDWRSNRSIIGAKLWYRITGLWEMT